MIARDLAQRHIQRFNRIGRIDDLPNVRWESKERDDSRPVDGLDPIRGFIAPSSFPCLAPAPAQTRVL